MNGSSRYIGVNTLTKGSLFQHDSVHEMIWYYCVISCYSCFLVTAHGSLLSLWYQIDYLSSDLSLSWPTLQKSLDYIFYEEYPPQIITGVCLEDNIHRHPVAFRVPAVRDWHRHKTHQTSRNFSIVQRNVIFLFTIPVADTLPSLI